MEHNQPISWDYVILLAIVMEMDSIIFLHFISVKLFKINIHLIFNLHRIGFSLCFTISTIFTFLQFWQFCNFFMGVLRFVILALCDRHKHTYLIACLMTSLTSCDISWHHVISCDIDAAVTSKNLDCDIWNWTTIFTCIYT